MTRRSPHQAPRPCSQLWWLLSGCLLLGACASAPAPRQVQPYRLDTVTSACRQNPANCAALAGKDVAVQPAASVGVMASLVVRALEDPVRDLIDTALAECADLARSEVLLRHRNDFAGPNPSKEECTQQVKDAAGRRVSRARQLGTEMHQVARRCAEERLGKLRPGGFSLEPYYRYEPGSGQTKHIPDEDVAALRESGNQGELLGTLAPDVVIHAGNPLHVQAVYDFKFPCHHLDNMPRWDTYPPGHPHHGRGQDQLYRTALGVRAARVAPRLGVQR